MCARQRERLLIGSVLVLALLVAFMPSEAAGMRVIFYAPLRRQVLTGQILSTSAKDEPCEKCFMRDHRGHCRRMLSFNVEGVRC